MSLPSGYTRLEYIQSSGTQYIDTEVSAPNGFALDCKVNITEIVANINNPIVAAHNDSSPWGRNYFAFDPNRVEIGQGDSMLKYATLPTSTDCAIVANNIYPNASYTLNGVEQSRTSGDQYSGELCSNSLYLLYCHGGSSFFTYSRAKLYYLKLTVDGELVRDFIPCKNASGVIGLWDDVNSTFYQNAGSGTFAAGPEVKGTHKTLINGAARDVASGTCLVGGMSYHISKGRTLINGMGRDIPLVVPVQYDPVFANNEWADIIAACQSGSVPETWTVGSQKSMSIGGTSYLVDIIGLNHDDYADGSGKAPLTLQLHDCYATPYQMSYSEYNSDSWNRSLIRMYFCPNTILANMPTDVQAGIKNVNKLTSAGGGSSTIVTTSDKLFLLAEIEVFASVENSFAGEGSRYEYYTNGGTSALKKNNAEDNRWWLRSPVNWNKYNYCVVYTKDGTSYYSGPRAEKGVCPAFCF